jgi:hypothetical protein
VPDVGLAGADGVDEARSVIRFDGAEVFYFYRGL